MRKDEFARYLREVRGQGETTVQSRLSNCARLEEYEGDLDALFDRDRMEDLIDRLAYSAEDERQGLQPRHNVPIDGNLRTGSATLKQAAHRYRDFRGECTMRKDEFARYLREVRGQGESTVGTFLSRCVRLEKWEGDLDAHFGRDEMKDLIDRLTYSAEDERQGRQPRHDVPIRGDRRKTSAALKTAASAYRDFRAGGGKPRRLTDSAGRKRKRAAAAPWPDWPGPSEGDMLGLARALARHARFLHPDIVAEVTKDNARHASEWRTLLDERGVDPDIYLWDGSPCAFPGVRRYAGSDEIALFRKRAMASAPPSHCLRLDDNDYPKHVWAFVFTGQPFRKHGPNRYQLAHLADHKEHNNRWREEFAAEGSGDPPRLFGLFTSAANTVFLPAAFLRPTDFSPGLRALLLRRAYRLYGGVCRLAPPPLVEKPPREAEWDPDDFEWAPPVGTLEHVPAFLEFRCGRIAGLGER